SKESNAEQNIELLSTLQQMELRQRQLEEALVNSQQEARPVDSESMQAILAQNAFYYERLARIIEETRSGAHQSAVSIYEWFSERMEHERAEYHQGLQYLAQQLEAQNYKEQAKEKLARQWLNRALLLSEFIQDHFDQERFRPGKYSRLLQRLDLAQGNLAAGAVDASLQISQQVFLDLSELHFELEHVVMEWQAEFERAQNTLYGLLNDIQQNPQVSAMDLQGQILPEQLDLDYWTNGKYSEALNRCRQFVSVVAEEQLSAEELRRIHTDVVPVITGYFDSVVYEARLKALNSQLRMNIAETALEALEMHGFQLQDSGYANKDLRSAFALQLKNADGSLVSIEVLPGDGKNQEFANELIVKTEHATLKTEHEARLQWEELCHAFRQYNLNVSRPEIQSTTNTSIEDTAPNLRAISRQRLQLKRPSDVR
ncbi:MAG TPA: hypothetical protein VK909_02125, partial [Anaerolineales bacterium]|nr:hypothetical protein [Anaerolineales bacterium]